MRILLRVIGVFAAITVLETIWFLLAFGANGMRALFESRMIAVATILGWVLTFISGPIATVQLFRLRRGGLVAALVLNGYLLLYNVIGGIASGPSHAMPYLIAGSALYVAAIVILITPAAWRICR